MRSQPPFPARPPLARRLLPVALAIAALALLAPTAADAGRFALGFHFGYPYALHGRVHLYGHGYWPGWGYGYRYHPVPAYPVVVSAHYPRAGGFDLNVRPKKTEVWVDGRFVGLAREFDGWPSYLWLRTGDHTLTFRHDGHRTESLQVRAAAGAVHDLRIRLREGVSMPPPEPGEAYAGSAGRRDAPPRRSARPPAAPEGSPPPPRPTAPGEPPATAAPAPEEAAASRDVRREPGQLRLLVQPEDAAVYLDGRLLGSAAELARLHAGLLVDPGDHLLQFVHPDRAPERLEVLVEEGEVVEVEVTLADGEG